jgi:hypothetical protein
MVRRVSVHYRKHGTTHGTWPCTRKACRDQPRALWGQPEEQAGVARPLARMLWMGLFQVGSGRGAWSGPIRAEVPALAGLLCRQLFKYTNGFVYPVQF